MVTTGINTGTDTAIAAVNQGGVSANTWITSSGAATGTTTNDQNQLVNRQLIYPRNVTWYFKQYIVVMLITNAVLLGASILGCIGHFVKPLMYVSGCVSLVASVTWFVLLILGTTWRFNHPGKICAGDFADKNQNEHITLSYNYRLGKCLFGLLITQYILIACCSCGCVGIGKKSQGGAKD